MKKQPYSISIKNQIAFFELNTPGSVVNIFTREAAEQVVVELGKLNPSEITHVVFTSSKPYSFINGTQLTLAPSIKNYEDVLASTKPTRRAFESIKNCPFVTISAISGACYGCGIEMTLHCDYRFISDSADSRFFMTELVEYHFPPIFGGIEIIPKLVGRQKAFDFIIKGEVWHSDTALQAGLVDAVLKKDSFESDIINQISRGFSEKRNPNSIPNKSQEITKEQKEANTKYLDMLPLPRQELHKGTNRLLEKVLDENLEANATSRLVGDFFVSLSAKYWTKATKMFFYQTMARTASLRTSSIVPSKHVVAEIDKQQSDGLHRLIRKRQLQHFDIIESDIADPTVKSDFVIREKNDTLSIPISILEGYSADVGNRHSTVLYFPDKRNTAFCEVFTEDELKEPLLSFMQVLFHFDIEVLVVPKGDGSVLNRFIEDYIDYVQMKLDHLSLIQLNKSFWEFGFENTIQHIFEIRNETLEIENSLQTTMDEDSITLDGFLLHLFQLGQQCIKEGQLKHNSQIDLVMKAFFGFPASKGSFCEYVKENAKP